MSFLRHREIYPSDGGKTLTGRAPAHRLDEFPTGYSWAGCSPAEPASASPASLILLRLQSFVYDVSANGNLSPILVSHHRGAAQTNYPFSEVEQMTLKKMCNWWLSPFLLHSYWSDGASGS